MSAIALVEFKGNFRRQGYRTDGGSVKKWPSRQDDTASGRAILVKTGRLRRALRSEPTRRFARVTNRTPYAAIHNRGGNIKGQARAFSTNLRTGNTRRRSSGHQATMPARPFMITTRPLLNDISSDIQRGLNKVFGT